MRIQHNIMAMNAYRNYTSNNSALSKNLEKLSSGYKINRAGDDAAGLAISEKMRAQITGLKTAQKNAKDGVSLVQTAEGSLTEVHSMLNRMLELADQSANGTYDDTTDRANLQKEFAALSTEIDRIGTSSNFNGIKLFDSDAANTGITLQIGAEAADTLNVKTFELSVANLAITEDVSDPTKAAAVAIELKAAINTVSGTRGDLGAAQNRLEHTINNLGVMTENIQDAEANIRDVDVAEEMMAYTKNNILVQSAQAMLAQANQVPQGVLQLLQ